ncbi:hypothetical protein HDU76_009061, partial [Blyttiomyces sp. JEL0837]
MDPHYYQILDIVIPNNLPPHVLVFSKGSVEAKLSGSPEEFSVLFTSVDNNRHSYPQPTQAYNRLLYTIDWTPSASFVLETYKRADDEVDEAEDQETPDVVSSEVVSVHEEDHGDKHQSEDMRTVQVVTQGEIAVDQEQQDEEMIQQEEVIPGQVQGAEHMMNFDEEQLAAGSQSSSHSPPQLPSNITSTQVVLPSQKQSQPTTPSQPSIGTSGVGKRRRSESQELLHMDIVEAKNKTLNEQLLDDINSIPSTLRGLKDSGKTIPVACIKNPLTPFQLESLNNLQLFLLACTQVAQQAGDDAISSIDQKKETISGDFIQFNLGNDLAMLDQIGVYVSQMDSTALDLFEEFSDFDISLITPALITNAKISILQVANGLLALFTTLLNRVSPVNIQTA